MIRLAYYSHPVFRAHDMGPGHLECPARVERIDERMRLCGVDDLVEHRDIVPVTDEQLVRAHTHGYVTGLQAAAPAEGHVWIDPDTMMMSRTLEAARYAAGAGVSAVDDILAGHAQRAFCSVRPPGHHATRGKAGGFCFFNNACVAIRHALASGRVQRVALFDFDVHHGNGSEDILAGDDRVMMFSTFQTGLYPFSGDRPLAANIVSAPLRPYSRGDAMRQAVEQVWGPAVDAFQPQMVFISAGFDAHRSDELGQLGWVDADFAWVTRRIVGYARRWADGRIVSMLEGGYDLAALSRCAELHLLELLELNADPVTPPGDAATH